MDNNTDKDKQEELKIRAEEASRLWPDAAVNAPVIESEPKIEPEPEPKVESEPEKNLGLSAIEQQLADLSKKLNDLSQIEYRLKQAESRIGGINNRLRDEQQAAEKAKALAPTAEQIAQAKQTEAEWKQLAEDYPEWSKAIDSRFRAENETLKRKLEEIEQRVSGNNSISPGQVQGLIEEAVLSNKYPNYLDDIASNDFKLWIQTQDDDTKIKYLQGTKAADAIYVLDKFHGRNAVAAAEAAAATASVAADIKTKRKQQLSAATLPSGVQPQQLTSKTEDQMTDAEYRRHITAQYWPR